MTYTYEDAMWTDAIRRQANETIRYCATCGGPEGSDYAKRCCVDDNMIED